MKPHRNSKHNMSRDEYRASGSRLHALRGTELPQAKLTEDAVAQARRLHARKQQLIKRLNERYGAAGLALRFGVATSTMNKVLSRGAWPHVEG